MSFQHRFVQGLGVEKRACSPSLRRSLLLCAMAVGLAAFSGRAGAADCTDTATEKLTPLSTCFPNDDVDITIGALDARAQCKRVYLDKSSRRFRRITINADGALCVRDADVASMPGRSLELAAGEIIVNGTFEVGSAVAAIGSSNPANHVEVVFSSGADKTPDDNRDVNKCSDTKFRKGLQLCEGGVLRLFGQKGAPADGKARLEPGQGSSPGKVSLDLPEGAGR
jgi:G8 domain